ncbi:MAG: cyclic nucleotide-binding domain-containing protein [Chloroflexota bacterium]
MLLKSFAETTRFAQSSVTTNVTPFLPYQSEQSRPAKNSTTYPKGETIIPLMGLGQRAFIVASGEVVILQNGRPVDLVEAGEYFDESIWLGAEAVALTECTIVPVSEPQPQLLQQ